jgi:polysaccharide export outer membrane protein
LSVSVQQQLVRLATFGHRNKPWLQRFMQTAVLLVALFHASCLFAQVQGDIRAYRLEPGDRITVTIFGHAELSGDLFVDDVGNVFLPLVGAVEAKGLTLSEFQNLVHQRFSDGFLKQPTVGVRITELRPLYVLGDVRTPGAYQFRYGSTVKSAVALAGGLGQLIQSTALTEFLQADERLRQLVAQRHALLVRRERIEAQQDGQSAFSPSPRSTPDGADIDDVVAVEQQIFSSQAELLQQQLALLQSQRPRLEKEIGALNSQISTAKDQIELVKQRLEQYGQLAKQGLSLTSTELQFKLTKAAYESEIWRLVAQTSRLQMDIGELDLKINEADASSKRQYLAELREVSERLRDVNITLPSAREIRELKLRQAASLPDVDNARTISVTRIRGGSTHVIAATDSTPLEPGDIIEVKQVIPRQFLPQGASTAETRTGAAVPQSPIGSASR